MQNEKERAVWHQTTVSWGQFLVAIVAVIVTVLGAAMVDRIAMDRRITVVEERQQFVLKSISEMQSQTTSFRAEIASKLENLQRSVNEVILALTRHEASQTRAQANGTKKVNE